MTSVVQLNQFDPSVPKPDENLTTFAETEKEVSLAYNVALNELEVLLKMVGEAEKPPEDDDIEGLKRYRDIIAQDVRRIGLRVNLTKKYLKARDAQFHYHAKRLRSKDRTDRLRLWYRQKKRELEGIHLQSGDAGHETALERLEEEQRVMVRCYNLEKYWERAMKMENNIRSQGDDLSSGCETDFEE